MKVVMYWDKIVLDCHMRLISDMDICLSVYEGDGYEGDMLGQTMQR